MQRYPLRFEKKHLFIEIEENKWLLDTGAPSSFGNVSSLHFAGKSFSIPRDYMGLNTGTLTEYLNIECTGLLGVDILNEFDHLFDIEKSTLSVSDEELGSDGEYLPLTEFMGIPIVTIQIEENEYKMFFDTGAQISYWQDSRLTHFKKLGTLTDFYPGFGQFETETYEVPTLLSNVCFDLRYGTLPGILGMTLAMGGTQGILGNEILLGRTVGYFPRRNLLCL